MLAKLLPMLVLGGITVHSSAAVKDRMQQVLGIGEGFVTKQRIGVILRAAKLSVVVNGELDFNDARTFRAWIRKSVRIEKKESADPSLDHWGTAFRYRLDGKGLSVGSAGPDKKFGSKDDIRAKSNIYNY